MSTVTLTGDERDLSGARASSAVRCKAMAEFQGLGIEGDPTRMDWLKDKGYLDRGLDLGEAWAIQQQRLFQADGKTAVREHAAPWGLGWSTHADLAVIDDKVVWEVQVAAGGAVREEKLLQAAFGADVRGPDWRAALAVIDPGDVDARDVMKVHLIPIEMDGPNGLRAKVREIQARVIAAVEAGAVNPADKVATLPTHSECFSCAFKEKCWEGYVAPAPEEIVGLETSFDALRIVQSDLHHAEAKVSELKRLRDEYRDDVREYLPAGREVVSGTTSIKRIEVAGRVSVKLGDFRKAGFEVPVELEPFVTEGKPSERWRVDAV